MVSMDSGEMSMAVIEGDIYTTRDAERIEKKGVPVIQINTTGGCHLSAEAINEAVRGLDLPGLDLLIIENVGNLVCPAEFNLGEDHKIAVLSTVEGDDKPIKYPLLFQEAGLVIINKMDLLPYTSFDMLQAESDIRSLNRHAPVLKVSALDHTSLEPWYDWLREHVRQTEKDNF
jgi:hydrogenase nickel incorporation protein HypB